MSAIITRRRASARPSVSREIDWSNPITRGLIFASRDRFQTPYSNNDVASYCKDGLGAVLPFKDARTGVGVDATNGISCVTNSGASTTAFTSIAAGSDFSFFALIDSAAFGGGNPGLWRNTATFGGTTFVIFNGTTGALWLRDNGTDFSGGGPLPATGSTFSVFVSVKSGARVDGWVDLTKQFGSSTSVPSTADMTGTNGIYILGYQFDSTNYVRGVWQQVLFWNRQVEEAEYRNLYADPSSVYRRSRRMYFGVTPAGNNTIAVPKGSLVLTTKAPTISNSSNQTVAVPKGSLTLTAKTPTVTGGRSNYISVPKGALSLTGKVPTVSATHNNLIGVPAATLTLTALAPTILGATVVARGVTPAGGIGGQKRRRKFVELDGKLIEVKSAKDAIRTIRAFAEREKQHIESKVARAVVKAVVRQEQVEVMPPEIAVSPDLAPSIIPQIETIRLDLNRAYEAAFIAMQQAMEEDDEDALMALLH